MSNVNSERRVEGDWWADPIPPNVQFGDGFYCETAQIFRFLRNRKAGRASRLGDHVSCYAGCSFSLGENGRCTVGDFTLMNGALVMAEELIEIGSYCLISWNVGIADSDFHPIDPAQRLIDALALAPFYKDRPPRPPHSHRARPHRGQCLDRNERRHSERRDDRRKFRRGRGLGGFEKCCAKYRRGRQSGGGGEEVMNHGLHGSHGCKPYS